MFSTSQKIILQLLQTLHQPNTLVGYSYPCPKSKHQSHSFLSFNHFCINGSLLGLTPVATKGTTVFCTYIMTAFFWGGGGLGVCRLTAPHSKLYYWLHNCNKNTSKDRIRQTCLIFLQTQHQVAQMLHLVCNKTFELKLKIHEMQN